MKIIFVKIKNNYGRDIVYPDCETSNIFASLAGTKTLSESDLALIEKLGYSIKLRPRLSFKSDALSFCIEEG